jgi:hypothetical protein
LDLVRLCVWFFFSVILVPMSLPTLFPKAPETGRLKSPQVLPYAQIDCVLNRREMTGTQGTWNDYRNVTITVRGLKEHVVQGIGEVMAVFNRDTTLIYPSGARFRQWWPDGEAELEQEETTKDGQDLWRGVLKAVVWSVRNK